MVKKLLDESKRVWPALVVVVAVACMLGAQRIIQNAKQPTADAVAQTNR